jgi:hypothetical protein
MEKTTMRFPTVTGANLQRKKLSLPQDFQGELNLVFIAFQQWQQTQVDTWIPFARQLEETHAGVRYYELPIIQRLNVLARTFINEGTRAGIPEPIARELDAFPIPARDNTSTLHPLSAVLLPQEDGDLWWLDGANAAQVH